MLPSVQPAPTSPSPSQQSRYKDNSLTMPFLLRVFFLHHNTSMPLHLTTPALRSDIATPFLAVDVTAAALRTDVHASARHRIISDLESNKREVGRSQQEIAGLSGYTQELTRLASVCSYSRPQSGYSCIRSQNGCCSTRRQSGCCSSRRLSGCSCSRRRSAGCKSLGRARAAVCCPS